MRNTLVTTVDNPFNPFKQWDEWFMWDTTHGYHTCSMLDRLCITSDELSEEDMSLSIDDAADRLCEYHEGTYVVVHDDDSVTYPIGGG